MLDNRVQHNAPRRESLQRDIDRFLDSGKMIEVLAAPGEEPLRPLPQYPTHFTLRGK